MWLIPLGEDACERAREVSQLSEEEVERAGRMPLERDRERFVTSRLWLRRLLADRLGIAPDEIRYGQSGAGKPELTSPRRSDLCFSLSRSGDVALCAFARSCPIGVDVEECVEAADLASMEGRFLSAPEHAALGELDGLRRRRAFYRIWARKEAFVKAAGVGLGAQWAAVDTTGELVRFEADVPQVPPGPWSVRDLDIVPRYAAAVSVRGAFGDARLPLRTAGAG